MAITMCPGQDTSFWRPGDIFEVECSGCGNTVEFFKDDASRRCAQCGRQVSNPKLNLGCAQWCEHAAECLGYDPKEKLAAEGEHTSLVDRLIEALGAMADGETLRTRGIEALEQARTLMSVEGGEPKVILSAALLSPLEPEHAQRVLIAEEADQYTAEDVAALLTGQAAAEKPETLEAKVLADALALAGGEARPEAMHTPAGKVLAEKMMN